MKKILSMSIVLLLVGQSAFSSEGPNLESFIGVYRGDALANDSLPTTCEVKIYIRSGYSDVILEFSNDAPMKHVDTWFFNSDIKNSTPTALNLSKKLCNALFCESNDMKIKLSEGKILSLDLIQWTSIIRAHYSCRNIRRVP